jgi:hypothetical protein
MALRQSAFLFNYQAYNNMAQPLMAALEVGDLAPLKATVAQIRQEVGAYQNWILHDQGTDIWDWADARDPRYQQAIWGHWLLIVLSHFLQPTISLEFDWTKLARVLHHFGWSDIMVTAVIYGWPVARLLKPKTPNPHEVNKKQPTPYWCQVRPVQNTYAGWLPIDEITRLHQQLQSSQHLLTEDWRNRIRLPPRVLLENAHVSSELDPEYWYKRALMVYQRAIAMMASALHAGEGLFMVVSEPEGDSSAEDDPSDE